MPFVTGTSGLGSLAALIAASSLTLLTFFPALVALSLALHLIRITGAIGHVVLRAIGGVVVTVCHVCSPCLRFACLVRCTCRAGWCRADLRPWFGVLLTRTIVGGDDATEPLSSESSAWLPSHRSGDADRRVRYPVKAHAPHADQPNLCATWRRRHSAMVVFSYSPNAAALVRPSERGGECARQKKERRAGGASLNLGRAIAASLARSHDSPLEGDGSGLCTIARAKFCEDRLHVRLDRSFRDVEPVGDLLIG